MLHELNTNKPSSLKQKMFSFPLTFLNLCDIYGSVLKWQNMFSESYNDESRLFHIFLCEIPPLFWLYSKNLRILRNVWSAGFVDCLEIVKFSCCFQRNGQTICWDAQIFLLIMHFVIECIFVNTLLTLFWVLLPDIKFLPATREWCKVGGDTK